MISKDELLDFVPINGFPEYMINKDGVIYSSKENKFLKTKPTTGLYTNEPTLYYRSKGMNKHGYKRVYKAINRLVYEHFSNDTDNLKNISKFVITHLDGNKSNNSIDNLQLVTRKQCLQKRKKKDNCSSDYIGVSWSNQLNVWCSKIEVNYKTYHLGNYIHEENGAYVYDKIAQHVYDSAFYSNESVKGLVLPQQCEDRETKINEMIDKINKDKSY